jgi:hypothetical protein
MSPCSPRKRPMALVAFSLLAVMFLSASALTQDRPVPKVDLFTGYQWLNPGATVPLPGHSVFAPVGRKLPGIPQGFGTALTYNFDQHWGLTFDYGGNYNKFGNESTVSIGPRFMWRTEGANFFAQTLLGLNKFTTKGIDSSNGLGAILGGGIDLPAWRFLTIRLFEADYQVARHNFSSVVGPQASDLRRPVFSGTRLRTGLVWNFGLPSATPPAASCSVQPAEVMAGEPVTATATGSNFNPKHTLNYSWSSTGGKVTGKDTTASIDTNGVAGGSYTVTAHITDPKMKKGGEASCTANFTVKEVPKNPPTISCTANPTDVQVGATSTITCECTSPDSVSVSVGNWSSTGGTVNGSGNTATLNTTGAQPGQVTVSATCTDSRGLSSNGTTNVTVEAPPPPPPPPPQASKLSSCDFPNLVKPWRVDNTCKAVLDDVAQRMQHDPDAKLVIVGNAEAKEKRRNLAAERAVNAKAYLSGGEAKQGIDASRIETRTGNAGTKTADFWVVPAGASFNEPDTTAVDESKVKPVPDHPRAPAKKKAMPKAQ